MTTIRVDLRLPEEEESPIDKVGLWIGHSGSGDIGGRSNYAYQTSQGHEGITLNSVSVNQTIEQGGRIHIYGGSLASIRPRDPKYRELREALEACGGWQ